MTSPRPTHAVIMTVQALTDAVDSARTQLDRARLLDLRDKYIEGMHDTALALDAARTRLIQDGEEYLDAAHTLLDYSRRTIATVSIEADKAGRRLAVGS